MTFARPRYKTVPLESFASTSNSHDPAEILYIVPEAICAPKDKSCLIELYPERVNKAVTVSISETATDLSNDNFILPALPRVIEVNKSYSSSLLHPTHITAVKRNNKKPEYKKNFFFITIFPLNE